MLSARYRTLEEVYSACRSCLGTRTWEKIVAACYDTLTPETFPDTLAFKVDAFGLPEFLPHLARLEWAQKVASSGGNTIPPEVDRLSLNPTLHLVRCSWKNLLTLICSGENLRQGEKPEDRTQYEILLPALGGHVSP